MPCLGDEDGILVIDETGFLKKGTKSAGVARLTRSIVLSIDDVPSVIALHCSSNSIRQSDRSTPPLDFSVTRVTGNGLISR